MFSRRATGSRWIRLGVPLKTRSRAVGPRRRQDGRAPQWPHICLAPAETCDNLAGMGLRALTKPKDSSQPLVRRPAPPTSFPSQPAGSLPQGRSRRTQRLIPFRIPKNMTLLPDRRDRKLRAENRAIFCPKRCNHESASAQREKYCEGMRRVYHEPLRHSRTGRGWTSRLHCSTVWSSRPSSSYRRCRCQ